MEFKDKLIELPTIEHLQGINIQLGDQLIHHIPAVQGKLGSLKVYNALAQEFDGILDMKTAKKGLMLFCEHTEDAKLNPGKHPNIDFLIEVIKQDRTYKIIPVIIETNKQ
ncbi:hypothetical protein EV697_11012 [Bisgaardia hudsonensis]|uniref:DUF2322 family protein n=1 Tax=Bisgaardia hudsonensis TaxID=109472 RepID=A0A4R2MVZ6_9PAST|nr:DUF2322 family protein [Bisgaardia hudsonensis]QLB13754.1 hypothetical protein A6A11_09090 [Bisgaardia hudsonensis]TCP11061.1 hypothetical protein EV697_11012 [Bisgaardia hudsonensis]